METKNQWQPIETAPRDSRRILVAYRNSYGPRVREVWWKLLWDGAPPSQCYWCYDNDGCLLDFSIHGLGATHWMPLPDPPQDGGDSRD